VRRLILGGLALECILFVMKKGLGSESLLRTNTLFCYK